MKLLKQIATNKRLLTVLTFVIFIASIIGLKDKSELLLPVFIIWAVVLISFQAYSEHLKDAAAVTPIPPKVIGRDFLHTHPVSERRLNVHEDHIIVDLEDWQIVVNYLSDHPQVFSELLNYEKTIPRTQ